MITTGSKLFYGLGTVATIGAILWFIQNDGGSLGAVALAFLAVALFFLGAIASFSRDGHVLSTDTAAHATSAAVDRPAGRSLWPLGVAVAAGTTVVGLVSSPGIFKVGVALLLAFGAEWLIQAWSERASADAGYNEKVRGWVIHPLEIPIGGALLLAVIVLSFSRVMLALSAEAGPIVFAILASLVLFFGTVLAFRRGANPRVLGGIGAVILLALSGVGVALALNGEREELVTASAEDHLATRPCEEGQEEADKDASRSMSAKSNIAAVITLENGALSAHQVGMPVDGTSITLQRSNPSVILFKNLDEGSRRMVVTYGKTVEDLGGGVTNEKVLEACTSLVDKGGEQMVSVNFPKPSFAATEPYSITVPGLEGQAIEVQVP